MEKIFDQFLKINTGSKNTSKLVKKKLLLKFFLLPIKKVYFKETFKILNFNQQSIFLIQNKYIILKFVEKFQFHISI